ncbi:MAG: cytosine deaminase, partial [Acidaminococcaceae bacterium]|nr:cytosine deaminase [Acidaminococcaceae bacterium]
MKTTLFINAKIKGQAGLQDIYVVDGKFDQIGVGLAAQVKADKIVDLEGKLVVPPYCDPHIHLDYVFTALNPAAANKTGSLFEGIQRWSETKGGLSIEEIKTRAKIAMKKEI